MYWSKYCHIGLMGLMLLACKPEEIKQYRVAKEPPKVMPASMSNPGATSSEGTDISYQAPPGWKAQAATGMRKVSISVEGGGDFSVVLLPGEAGDLKSNINRWRGQVALAPLNDPEKEEKNLEKITVDGHVGYRLTLEAPPEQPDKAMRVVLLKQGTNHWFFKLAGTRELVKKQSVAFDQLMASVKIKAASTPSAAVPAQTPPVAMQPTPGRLKYTKPADWREDKASGMRAASFKVNQDNQVADISVISLAGDGGGLLENTNRWREQLEMAPTDQDGLKNSVKDITVDGHTGYYMALYTGLEGDGMLVALIKENQTTWFIKMMGPHALIQGQEQNFQKFIQSLKFQVEGK